MQRQLAPIVEGLIYGPSYAYLNYLIRSPRPLEAEATWQAVAGRRSPFIEWARNEWPPAFCRPWLLARKQREDARLGIAAHYDVSNEFYELFLDKKYMFYSCADFRSPDDTLEDAQTRKADFIFKLIDPRPGERILELGCGWGSMLKRIYEATGDKQNLFGYTLSREQAAYNLAHGQFNVEFQNFLTADYRPEFFDKIYSIGAWEHVRPQEEGPVLEKLFAALKPGGRLVKHFFCRLTDRMPASAIISQIFFPGAVNSSYRFHLRNFEAAGFLPTHQSIHDYRPTLRAWFDNLVANRERALELVDVQTYNRYLVFFPAAWRYFDDVTGALFRFVLEKPALPARPPASSTRETGLAAAS